MNTDVIDDDWGAGYVGLFRASGNTSTHTFDNFKVGLGGTGFQPVKSAADRGQDAHATRDISDSGDDIQIDDNFDTPGRSRWPTTTTAT